MAEPISEDFRLALFRIIGDVERHAGAFSAAFDYLSMIDQLKALAALHDVAWSAELEDALVHWQLHHMFGTPVINEAASRIVDASGLLRLSPPQAPKRRKAKALDREATLDMAFAKFQQVFRRCSSPYPNHPGGVWLKFQSPEDLFVFYDLPPHADVAYPALFVPKLGYPADLGLLLSGLMIDQRTEVVEMANAIKVLAALCQCLAEALNLTGSNSWYAGG